MLLQTANSPHLVYLANGKAMDLIHNRIGTAKLMFGHKLSTNAKVIFF